VLVDQGRAGMAGVQFRGFVGGAWQVRLAGCVLEGDD
jgi:hypothetical protein